MVEESVPDAHATAGKQCCQYIQESVEVTMGYTAGRSGRSLLVLLSCAHSKQSIKHNTPVYPEANQQSSGVEEAVPEAHATADAWASATARSSRTRLALPKAQASAFVQVQDEANASAVAVACASANATETACACAWASAHP